AVVRRGPLARRRPDELPRNQPLPAVYRSVRDERGDPGQGPGARDAELARVEAALLAADEPLLPRKLALAAGFPDAAAARRLLAKLQKLYDDDGTAFQVAELARGYQLLTRPEYHRW